MATVGEYLLYYGINLLLNALVVLLYHRNRRPQRRKVFMLVMAGALVYVVVDQMLRMEIGLGVGFGIFAIFSLLRFRTVPVSLRDMTYLFTVVTLSMVNALMFNSDDRLVLPAVNLALLATLTLLEFGIAGFGRDADREQRANVSWRDAIALEYDNLKLLDPRRRQALLADLRERTGLEPQRVRVERIDLQAGTARLRLDFAPPARQPEEEQQS